MLASPSDPNAVARLIDRLLADPGFCARFRQQPVATCRAAGLDDLADEVERARGKALETLDVRESRSGMVGVILAAALEGTELAESARRPAGDVSPDVEQALGRVSSPETRAALGGANEQPPPDVAARHITPRPPEPAAPRSSKPIPLA